MHHEIFTEVVREHKDGVYAYALHWLASREEAEDVTQDTFVAYWRGGDHVPPDGVKPWLLRVCRNACIDRHRREHVRRSRIAPQRGDASAEIDLATDLGAGAARIESRLELEHALKLLAGLAEPGRSVVVLRDVLGLSYEEIAATLEISLASVKVTLHRARRRLRAALEAPTRVDR